MKKSFWITLIAGIATVVAATVAIVAVVRRKTNAIAQELDFEPDDYFDEEEGYYNADACDDCVVESDNAEDSDEVEKDSCDE